MKNVLNNRIKKERPNAAALGAFVAVLSIGGGTELAKKAAGDDLSEKLKNYKKEVFDHFERKTNEYLDSFNEAELEGKDKNELNRIYSKIHPRSELQDNVIKTIKNYLSGDYRLPSINAPYEKSYINSLARQEAAKRILKKYNILQ